MQTRKVKKFDHLSAVLQIDNSYVKISFCGAADQVRLAVRDAIYGLGMVGKVDMIWEHPYQLLKTEANQQALEKGKDRIDIRIHTKEFNSLVLMLRYCNQIGLSNLLIEFGSQFMIARAKQLADSNQDILPIQDYERPSNRLFWLKEELETDAKARSESERVRRDHIRLFNASANHAKTKKEIIKEQIDNIVSLVQRMVDSHPKNYNFSKTSFGYYYLSNYDELKQKNGQDCDLLNLYKNDFELIRDVDKTKFRLLAEKYSRLQNEFEEFNKAPVSVKKTCCTLV